MAGFLDRIKSVLGGFMPNRTVGSDYKILFNGDPTFDGLGANRMDLYSKNRARLRNTYYNTEENGGYREDLLKNVFKLEDDVLLTGLYNPVPAIVDTYQNVLRGKWGAEINIAPTIGGPDGKEVNPALIKEDVIGKIWQMSNTAESVQEAIWATWVAVASGEEPNTIRIGRHTLAHIRQDVDGPTPSLQPLAAKLDFAGAVMLGVTLIDQLVQRQPELLLTHIKALSGQSGETIAKLQTAAVSKIEGAMATYEDALGRALKIGMSFGILYGMWDLGTGMGNREVADRAFNEGYEDFEFIDRAPTPETIYDKYQRAKYEQAAGMAKAEVAAKVEGIVPLREQLRILFPNREESEIEELAKEMEKQNEANKPPVKPGQQTVRNESGQNGSLDGGILRA